MVLFCTNPAYNKRMYGLVKYNRLFGINIIIKTFNVITKV